MTIRPRYTLRAKAQDFHELFIAVGQQVGIIAGAVRPHAELLAAVVRSRTTEIVTSRYTDPKEPR